MVYLAEVLELRVAVVVAVVVVRLAVGHAGVLYLNVLQGEQLLATRRCRLGALRATYHWALLLHVILLQYLCVLLADEVGFLRGRAALKLGAVLVDQGELLRRRRHAVAAHLRHRRLLVLQIVHLLHVEELLLDQVVLVVVLELLGEARREVHLLGLAQVVVRQTVQVHLVELLRLLRLSALAVLSHPIVLALGPALAQRLPLVLLRARQLTLPVQGHALAESAVLRQAAQHDLSALKAVLALLWLQLKITGAFDVILLYDVVEWDQVR